MLAVGTKKPEKQDLSFLALGRGKSCQKAEDNLRKLLDEFESRLKFQHLDFYTEKGYQRLMEILREFTPAVFTKYEDFLTTYIGNLKSQITCSRRCHYCCAHNVTSVEPFELIFIDWHLKQSLEYSSLIISLFQRQNEFNRLAEAEKKYDEDLLLYKYFLKGLPCPFLDSKMGCRIYSIRPMPCRMFFSLSEPLYCFGEKSTCPENKNFIVELPDDIEFTLSQIRLVFGKLDIPEFFFSGLLQVNELFGRFLKG